MRGTIRFPTGLAGPSPSTGVQRAGRSHHQSVLGSVRPGVNQRGRGIMGSNSGGLNTGDAANGGMKRRAVTTVVLLSVFGALFVFGIPGAFAHLPTSPPLLALEGSASADGAGGALPDDWNRLYCSTNTCTPNP